MDMIMLGTRSKNLIYFYFKIAVGTLILSKFRNEVLPHHFLHTLMRRSIGFGVSAGVTATVQPLLSFRLLGLLLVEPLQDGLALLRGLGDARGAGRVVLVAPNVVPLRTMSETKTGYQG